MATYRGKYPNRIHTVYGLDKGKKYLFVTNAGERLELTTAQIKAAGFVNAPPGPGTEIDVLKSYAKNPASRKPRISRTNITPDEYVKRPSQITRKAPTKRAQARRKMHLDSGLPPGYYPNPIAPARLAIGFNAGNDRNGNPRAGWLVCEIIRAGSPDASVKILEWVDKGYRGNANLYKRFPDIPGIGEFSLSAADLKAYQKLYRIGFSD